MPKEKLGRKGEKARKERGIKKAFVEGKQDLDIEKRIWKKANRRMRMRKAAKMLDTLENAGYGCMSRLG